MVCGSVCVCVCGGGGGVMVCVLVRGDGRVLGRGDGVR